VFKAREHVVCKLRMIRWTPRAQDENASRCLHFRGRPDKTSFDLGLGALVVVNFLFYIFFSALTIGLYSKRHCYIHETSALEQACRLHYWIQTAHGLVLVSFSF
jgi:hypothetical protein